VGVDGKELNPFQWNHVRLNLPGTKGYDPGTTCWISKQREDGRIACDVFTFVDDEHILGLDDELAWQASHTFASKQSYLGLQDAGRKTHPCSKTCVAWVGVIVHITSKEKWLKMRAILEKWEAALAVGDPKLVHKELLADRAFLYVMRTYPALVPYLKGFHLTIKMWWGGRDVDGWKLKTGDNASNCSASSLSSLDVMQAGGRGLNLDFASTFMTGQVEDEDTAAAAANHCMCCKLGKEHVCAPADGITIPVPRLRDDVAALLKVTAFDLPPLHVVCPSWEVNVYYGFGDASGN